MSDDQSEAASDIDDQVNELRKKRGIIKGKLTLFSKYLHSFSDSKLSDRQLLELSLRLESAKCLLNDFNKSQDALEELYLDDEEGNTKLLEAREQFENFYYSSMSLADILLGKRVTMNDGTHDVAKCHSQSAIKLPTISLPSFDGSYDNWLEYRDTFLSMIHSSNNLDNIQKFHYLRSAFTGNALQVIKSLEFSSGNYIIAWDLLENRYNNTKLLVHNYVKALFSMHSITKESPSLIRKLIDSVLKNIRALKYLGEPTESWDTLIIHIIISKLDPATEKEWEQFKMNNIHSVDKLQLIDLIEFLRNKSDMLETIKANNNNPSSSSSKSSHDHFRKSPQKTVSLISTKSNKFSKRTRICNMCNNNHALYSCSQFLALSAKDKLDFVVGKNLCRNCLRAGHSDSECYFGPCRQCNKKHNSLLQSECSKDSASISVLTKTSDQIEANHSTVLHTAHVTPVFQGDESTRFVNNNNTHALQTVLLSTAVIEVLGGDNKYHKARALLDSGSQHCIITK